MISSSQFFNQSLFNYDEVDLREEKEEVGPWKSINSLNVLEKNPNYVEAKEKAMIVKKIKKKIQKHALFEELKKNHAQIPAKDAKDVVIIRRSEEKQTETGNSIHFPSIFNRKDSLSHFEYTKKNRNHSPLADDLRRILRKREKQKRQRKNQSFDGVERYMKKVQNSYNIYEKCIREQKRKNSRYSSIEH